MALAAPSTLPAHASRTDRPSHAHVSLTPSRRVVYLAQQEKESPLVCAVSRRASGEPIMR